jgi:GDP-mannose 6-dehydrogenase
MHDLDLPILTSILPSNEIQVNRGLRSIIDAGKKRIGILGFSFKAGTDDLRESPMVEIIERLLGKGFDLRIYDPNVNLASIVGANRDYILNHIPHISKLMVDYMDAVLEHAQIVVIGNNNREFEAVPERMQNDQILVDLVHITEKKSGQLGEATPTFSTKATATTE